MFQVAGRGPDFSPERLRYVRSVHGTFLGHASPTYHQDLGQDAYQIGPSPASKQPSHPLLLPNLHGDGPGTDSDLEPPPYHETAAFRQLCPCPNLDRDLYEGPSPCSAPLSIPIPTTASIQTNARGCLLITIPSAFPFPGILPMVVTPPETVWRIRWNSLRRNVRRRGFMMNCAPGPARERTGPPWGLKRRGLRRSVARGRATLCHAQV